MGKHYWGSALWLVGLVIAGWVMVVGSIGYAGPGDTYTGLVIDARGHHLLPAMSPKVRDTSGKEIYGTLPKLDVKTMQIVQEKGIVQYTSSLSEALSLESVIGEHPMMIQAVGGGKDPWKANVVVDPKDGERILKANEQKDFLKKMKVVLVI